VIVGIGHDVCDAKRIARALDRFGERFTGRVFTAVERAKCDRRLRRADSYARRFAAKEACSKALGTGIRRGVHWRDIGVVNLPGGKPTLELTGGALARLRDITPPGSVARIDVSLTDDRDLAHAIVVISALPAAPA
jgi:holo-[acyl-carrier protein] synthase